MEYYKEKDQKYFATVRNELIALIDLKDHLNILEIGAAGGDTLIAIKNKNNTIQVTGLELFELAGSNQKSPLINKFHVGNIEEMDFPEYKDQFDYILIGDVLEHLLDPWKQVEKISTWLKKEGKLIVSTPNIRDIESLYKIAIKGNFQYGRSGVLDKTHFRFFCKKNIIDLVTNKNLVLEKIESNFKLVSLPSKRRLLNTLTFGIFEEFLATQYITVSKKTHSS